MQLFSNIFGGLAGAGGAMLAKSTTPPNPNQKQPYEADTSQVQTPTAYHSEIYGDITGNGK